MPKVLLIVPPFSSLHRPSIGVHILERSLRDEGIECNVFYSNAEYAKLIGFDIYEKIAFSPTSFLIGERMFAHALEKENHPNINQNQIESLSKIFRKHEVVGTQLNTDLRINDVIIDDVITQQYQRIILDKISAYKPTIVGLSCTFQQICSSEFHAMTIKRRHPEIELVVGGGNCDGDMGRGFIEFTDYFDKVFSGESDLEFKNYCLQGIDENKKVISCSPVANLESDSFLNYEAYYKQLRSCGYKNLSNSWLTYETSRGCWWGQKSHCTFCGLNGQGMGFRRKDPDKALVELKHLMSVHSSNKVFFVDNILSHDFIKTFLPKIQEEIPGISMFYETKSNLKYEELRIIKESGINYFQPGIESLSTPLLKLMKKGVSGRANLRLLINAKKFGLRPTWYILYGFPDDKIEWYESMIRIIPSIIHLPPPNGTSPISIDRFSPLFEEAESFGVNNVEPIEAYYDIFGKENFVKDIAYHHIAEFYSELLTNEDTVSRLNKTMNAWTKRWLRGIPKLKFIKLSDQITMVIDSRKDKMDIRFIPKNIADRCFEVDNKKTKDIDRGDFELFFIHSLGYIIVHEGIVFNLVEEYLNND